MDSAIEKRDHKEVKKHLDECDDENLFGKILNTNNKQFIYECVYIIWCNKEHRKYAAKMVSDDPINMTLRCLAIEYQEVIRVSLDYIKYWADHPGFLADLIFQNKKYIQLYPDIIDCCLNTRSDNLVGNESFWSGEDYKKHITAKTCCDMIEKFAECANANATGFKYCLQQITVGRKIASVWKNIYEQCKINNPSFPSIIRAWYMSQPKPNYIFNDMDEIFEIPPPPTTTKKSFLKKIFN